MKPVIALVGRPNVGKSTLFNVLTRTRDAIVANFPGLTRDRQYGKGVVGETDYLVIDTGGLSGDENGIDGEMASQSLQAIEESNAIIFLVDGKERLTPADEGIAKYLRQTGKPVFLVVNKTDRVDPDIAIGDFFSMGIGEPIPIAASHNRGVRSLIEDILASFAPDEEVSVEQGGIKVAIVGRPNVGKSTLVNRIMGEERVVVFDMPGTTRDSIYIPFERDGTKYTLIDTAGVRRRARVKQTVEKFSVIKTLQAIDDAHVVVMVLDAHEGLSDQDAHLFGFILDSGRALVVAINKWDGLETDERDEIKRTFDRKFPFLSFAKTHFISALHGTGVGNLYASIDKAYDSAMADFSTSALTELLESLVMSHQPPMVKGRRIKMRYAHQGGKNPPRIIIHG
ncbi:MAG: ribosome biogenesis GTPase Der, partial [Chromatiales bacterium]|nr:ribosome biogenesis GTPase Der [Chromatiales bacterium]